MKIKFRPQVIWLSVLLTTFTVPLVKAVKKAEEQAHMRQKRVLWFTTDGRLALPPGTTLVVTPTLALPFVRYPPQGFLSNLSISLPFTIQFDKLGLTDNQNPYGALPNTLERNWGRKAGQNLADYIGKVVDSRRNKRELPKAPPQANFHGGERALLYTVVEDFLANFGMDGKACLLRAICEVHGNNMDNFGFLGEFLQLFFTASRSPYAAHLSEYVEAEESGIHDGECWKYYKSCPKSLFAAKHPNKYRGDQNHDQQQKENSHSEEDMETNYNTIEVDNSWHE